MSVTAHHCSIKKAKAALFILCNLVRPIGKFVTVYKHVDVVKETAGLS